MAASNPPHPATDVAARIAHSRAVRAIPGLANLLATHVATPLASVELRAGQDQRLALLWRHTGVPPIVAAAAGVAAAAAAIRALFMRSPMLLSNLIAVAPATVESLRALAGNPNIDTNLLLAYWPLFGCIATFGDPNATACIRTFRFYYLPKILLCYYLWFSRGAATLYSSLLRPLLARHALLYPQERSSNAAAATASATAAASSAAAKLVAATSNVVHESQSFLASADLRGPAAAQ